MQLCVEVVQSDHHAGRGIFTNPSVSDYILSLCRCPQKTFVLENPTG